MLIVDAAPPFRCAIRGLLERRGYTIAGKAGSAASAIACVDRLEPHAVLIDVDLRDGSGFELTTQLGCARPRVAVLLTSNGVEDCFYALARNCGASGYVPKQLLSRVDFARFWPGARRRAVLGRAL